MRGFWAAILGLMAGPALAGELPLPAGLVDLQSAQGQQYFQESTARAAFFPLAEQFVTQQTQSYCGVASLVMVLNNLPVAKPVSAAYAPFTVFTQDDLFDDGTDAIIKPDHILHHGITLDQLGALAAHYGANARVVHATADGLAQFRHDAAAALATPGDYVLVNFVRVALQEVGYGHISPLGAYDAKSDRFLIMDVARYKYPPAWVKTADLYAALDTVDRGNNGATRGYVILSMK